MTTIYYELPFKIKEPDAVYLHTDCPTPKIYISLLWTDIRLDIDADGSFKWHRRHFDGRRITEEEALQEVGL